MASEFPAELEQFIAQHIESLPQLEALLLVSQEPDRVWSCADFARYLYINADVCGALVAELEKREFIERLPGSTDQFRYRRTSEATDLLIKQLASLYQERRVAVITQIYSKPMKKVQTFADAFRFRREP